MRLRIDLLVAAGLVAFGVAMAGYYIGGAPESPGTRYQILVFGAGHVWRLNTHTGEVVICSVTGNTGNNLDVQCHQSAE